MTQESFQEFIESLGPLVEGETDSPRGSKIHAVRAKKDRSWCGRWGVTPTLPNRKWEPDDSDKYCGQCVAVWKAAAGRNQEVENMLLHVEKLIANTRKERRDQSA